MEKIIIKGINTRYLCNYNNIYNVRNNKRKQYEMVLLLLSDINFVRHLKLCQALFLANQR